MKPYLLISMIVCSLFFSGCAQTGGNNATTGAILGGITGAFATSGHTNNPAVTLLGTLAGAIIGSEIGAHMDELDRECASRAFERAYCSRPGRVIIWDNPRNGHYGEVVIIRDGRTPRGEYCREFKNKVFIDGRVRTTYGTVCKRANGEWRIVR